MVDSRRTRGQSESGGSRGDAGPRRAGQPGDSRGGESGRRNVRRGDSARGGRAARQKPSGLTPQTILLIGLPLVGILILVGYRLMPKQEEAAAPVVQVTNEQSRMDSLIQEIASLEREGREAMRLLRQEGPDAKKKGEAFREHADRWLEQWAEVTVELKDADGRFKPEYRGYEDHMKRVSVLLLDYNKAAPF